jgi:hypothetical protein
MAAKTHRGIWKTKAEIAFNFRPLLICKGPTIVIGATTIAMLVVMSKAVSKFQNATRLMHLPLM